jgi:hypothetical protein
MHPDAVIPSIRHLRAGDLIATYTQGSLRNIRLGSRELLRQIYFAVRDQHWNTIPATITHEAVNASDRGFHIQIAVEHLEAGVDFRWTGTLTGGPDNRITFAVAGQAHSEFLRNRIGLCVLHPLADCAGRPCEIEHLDGTREQSRFPELVSPHQPFLAVRAISHQPFAGTVVRVSFSGGVFETEDQRNWSDASFKTYSTPLSLPFPVMVRPGDGVEQQVELLVGSQFVTAAAVTGRDPVEIEIDWSGEQPIPAIGAAWNGMPRSAALSHLRVDVNFADLSWPDDLAAAAGFGVALEIAVFTADPHRDLAQLHVELTRLGNPAVRLIVFSPDGTLSQPEMLNAAREIFKDVLIGGGSNTNFVEVNRNRHGIAPFDFVSWPVNPRVHATDDQTMIENLEGQSPAITTARAFCPNRRLSISPVMVPEFAASSGWIAISLKHLLTAGISSVTYKTADPILHEICQFDARAVVPSTSSEFRRMDALILRKPGNAVAWIANFQPESQRVRIGSRETTVDPLAVLRLELED